jgi:hypothetical protein
LPLLLISSSSSLSRLSLALSFPPPLSLYLSAADIKTTSDAMVARVDRATNTLIIIGTSTAVRGVRLMLDTQVREWVREGREGEREREGDCELEWSEWGTVRWAGMGWNGVE